MLWIFLITGLIRGYKQWTLVILKPLGCWAYSTDLKANTKCRLVSNDICKDFSTCRTKTFAELYQTAHYSARNSVPSMPVWKNVLTWWAKIESHNFWSTTFLDSKKSMTSETSWNSEKHKRDLNDVTIKKTCSYDVTQLEFTVLTQVLYVAVL